MNRAAGRLPPGDAISPAASSSPASGAFRDAIIEYIRDAARPPDKFSHQLRVYNLARKIAGELVYDDDVLFAAAWMHDLGVFIGHRPEDPALLAKWGAVDYAVRTVPAILEELGFPYSKIQAVCDAIGTHLASSEPVTVEGTLLRDADLLEQLGAMGILRTAGKLGRDTRYVRHEQVVETLRRACTELPSKLRLPTSQKLAEARVAILKAFLDGVEAETM